jgi:tripartite-type tricarboxylate transporter receptor subunit TctC
MAMKKGECTMKKFLTLGLAAAISIAAFAPPAFADYPEKPVQFVVPWPPGDLEDVLTRLIAEKFQEMYGAPAAVVNRPGGGAVVGATEVMNAAPDGYTIGSFVVGVPTVKTMGANAPFKRDTFEPVGIFLTYPFLIAAKKDAPYKNVAELAEYSKTNPVRLGHFGYGLEPTLLSILGLQEKGGKFSAEAAFDMVDCSVLMNGDADVINTTAQLVLPCLSDLTVLATITEARTSVTPDVPTLGEQTGVEASLWNGLFVPKGTPQEVKDKIEAAAKAAIESPEAQDVAKTTGALVYWKDAAESQKVIDADYEQLKATREKLGVTD